MTTSQQFASPAHAYQAYYGPAIFGPLSDRVLAVAAPAPGDRVLEVASGTGILTRKLAAAAGQAGRVVGIDLNPKMVEVATAHSTGVSVTYAQGDGCALDLPDGGFDAVYCQQGLQFFPDRAAGMREMRRVLNPGGRAVVACWHDTETHPLFEALADAEEPHLAASGVDVDRGELVAPFSLGDADELITLAETNGFAGVQVQPVSIEARFPDADHFVEHMQFAYAAVIPQFADDPAAFATYLDAVVDDTRDLVRSYCRGDHVVVPMHANVAVATTG